jgi:hypothetical protein
VIALTHTSRKITSAAINGASATTFGITQIISLELSSSTAHQLCPTMSSCFPRRLAWSGVQITSPFTVASVPEGEAPVISEPAGAEAPASNHLPGGHFPRHIGRSRAFDDIHRSSQGCSLACYPARVLLHGYCVAQEPAPSTSPALVRSPELDARNT